MKFHDFSPFYRSSEGIKPKVSGDRLLDNPLVADLQSGASFKFDGSNDVVTFGSDGAAVINGLTHLTLEMWFKADVTSTNRVLIFGSNTSNDKDAGFSLRYDSAGNTASNMIKAATPMRKYRLSI